MPYYAFILAALAFCHVAHAQSREVVVPLPAGARVQVAPLSDGLSVGVFIRGIDADTLVRSLRELKPAQVQVLTPTPKQTVAYLRFAHPVTLAEASLGAKGSKAHQGLAVHIRVATQDAHEAVLAHAWAGPLPLPASLDAEELREADHQLLSGHVAQAELMLDRLKGAYALHAWVLVRLGDVAVHNRDTTTACNYYTEAKGEGLERTASMLALLRARVLGCPSPTPPAWDKLLGRDAIDDPVGQRIGEEAKWALGYEQDLTALRSVQRLEGKSYTHTLDRALREKITARIIRLAPPLGVAAAGEHPSNLAGHPEAFDLDLATGTAWCTLGSPQSWRQRSSQTSSWMTLSPSERRSWQRQASACTLARLPALKKAQPKAAKSLPEQHLTALRQRLSAATQVAHERLDPPTPKAAAPSVAEDAPSATPDTPADASKEQQ